VQVNVVDLHLHDSDFSVPTDLVALANKEATTLATCFETLLRDICSAIFKPANGGGAPEAWFAHIMIGDAVGTNEAAAKLLMSIVRQRPLPGARYFLLLVKCGSHQVALTAKGAVIGPPALAAAGGGAAKPSDVTATAVRLYKYALRDYYEDFVNSIRAWVFASPDELAEELAEHAASLQSVYGKRVIPDAMLEHVAAVTSEPLASRSVEDRMAICDNWIRTLVDLLKPDEHPTLTRFFTHRSCIDRMLTMSIVGLSQAALKTASSKLRDKNQQRFKNIQRFFRHEASPQLLRRDSLLPPAPRRGRSADGQHAKGRPCAYRGRPRKRGGG